MNYVVYQSYGSTDILNECCYSILSLLKHGFDSNQNKIVIYTDHKDYFSFLPAENLIFIELTKDEKIIIDILKENDTVSIDDINYKSGLSSSGVAAAILNLELQNVILSLPGKLYRIS